jgi:Flp pilus assembly secretin CpaC
MRGEKSKMKLRAVLEAALALAALASVLAVEPVGAQSGSTTEQRTLYLNAGETRVINHLMPGSTPALRIIQNPHALLIHDESPGELVILGAERGRWEVTVQLDNGRTVAYQVNVSAVGDMERPLEPGVNASADETSASLPNARDPAFAPAAHTESGPPKSPMALPTKNGSPARPSSAALLVDTSREQAVGASSLTAMAEPVREKPPAAPTLASQTARQAAGASATFRTNPPVAASGGMLTSPSVSGGPNYMPVDGFSMMAGTSEVVDFRRRLKRISIADSSVADVQVINPYQLNLIAHKPGFTTLAVWDDQGHYEERQVRVDPGGKQQVMLNVIVAELNRTNLENQGINYSFALAKYGVSLVGLPGAVATPYSQQAGSSAGQSTVLPAGGSIMPLLLSQNLTYGLAAQNSNVLTQSLFQYLEQHNLGKILAEPHLLASSGEQAKFLSGGEIPIVVAQALNTSIVFKQFGTSVVFLPTVVGTRDIELLVKPEVSEPDYSHGVELFGFQVPAFVTRRAETMVRLRDGQTLIIAGLILHQKQSVVQKVPYLGDIPFAGGLFRNTNWQDVETDLVMSVTPQIVNPLPASTRVFIPTGRGPLTSREIRTTRLAVPDAARPRF